LTLALAVTPPVAQAEGSSRELGTGISSGAARAAEPGRIVIGGSSVVPGKNVRLADIALLEGGAVAFADVELGPSPDPGASRRIDGITILRRLGEAGLDGGTIRYLIPPTVRLERAFQVIGEEEIKSAIERDSATFLHPREIIRSIDPTGTARIALGDYRLRVAADPTGRGARRRVEVEVLQEDKVVATVSARLEVTSHGPVLLTRRALARGAVLAAEDVTVEERDLSLLPPDLLSEESPAIGQQTRVALAAGAPVTLKAIVSPTVVRRGDLVTMVIETPAMRLSAPGEALEAGAPGAPVRVRNRQSKQELSAQVVKHGVVVVSR
jgi:flagella basal body P-ring formation protein FlgA